MKRPFAKTFEVDGEHVLCYVDQIENSEGEQVWAVITQFITENESVARLETSYYVETTLEQVLNHLFNEENQELHIDAIRKILKTIGSFGV